MQGQKQQSEQSYYEQCLCSALKECYGRQCTIHSRSNDDVPDTESKVYSQQDPEKENENLESESSSSPSKDHDVKMQRNILKRKGSKSPRRKQEKPILYSIHGQNYSIAKEKNDAQIFKEQQHFIYNPEAGDWAIQQLEKLLEELKEAEEKDVINFIQKQSKTLKDYNPKDTENINWLIVPNTVKDDLSKRIQFMRKQYNILKAIEILEQKAKEVTDYQIRQKMRQIWGDHPKLKQKLKQLTKYKTKYKNKWVFYTRPQYIALYTEKLLNLNQLHQQFQGIFNSFKFGPLRIQINPKYPIYPQLCLNLYNSCCRFTSVAQEYLDYHHKQYAGILQEGSSTHLSILVDHTIYVQIGKDNIPHLVDQIDLQAKQKWKKLSRYQSLSKEKSHYTSYIVNCYREKQQLAIMNKKKIISKEAYQISHLLARITDSQKLSLQHGNPIYKQMQNQK